MNEAFRFDPQNEVANKILSFWQPPKIEEKPIVYWKCLNCLKEQPESIECFEKFGKKYCSMDCLGKHAFK